MKRKVYTRRGDLGETATIGGPRIAKDTPRIEACGQVDELSSHLGLVRAELAALLHADHAIPQQEAEDCDAEKLHGLKLAALRDIDLLLRTVQGELFQVGAELATPDAVRFNTRTIAREHIEQLEREIDLREGQMPEQRTFILPSGTRAAAQLHVARTVCRRVERRLITLVRDDLHDVSRVLMAYLNRLADLLFVLARYVNHVTGVGDEKWEA